MESAKRPAVARIWHGETRASDADAYAAFLLGKGTADYRATPGFGGVVALRRIEGDRAHFVLISLWESMDAVRRFAGADAAKARYYPEDDRFLLAFEPNAEHYEVLATPDTAPA